MSQPTEHTKPAPDTTYYHKRIVEELAISEERNTFTAYMPGVKDGPPIPVQRKRFEATPKGDIRIFYYRPDGSPYTYHPKGGDEDKGTRTWAKDLYRDRLQVPYINHEGKEQKYKAPTGSHNCPYFTPQLIEAYRSKTEIPLLVITEGEFKAVAGCNEGLHVVGLSGLHGMYDPDGSKKLHFDIIDVLRVCRVRKLLYLTDADSLSITYKPDKDLAERPRSFFSAVRNFREAAMYHIEHDSDMVLRDVYYGHIAHKHNNPKSKGLDDLLRTFAFNKDRVLDGIRKLSFDNEYFSIYPVTDGLNKISEHFGLSSPERFYTVYQEFIQLQEFRYKKQTYQWNESDEKLHRIQHEDVRKFMRIGCDWFKLVMVPNKYGELDEEIKKWKVSEIQRDYVKQFPTFLEDIRKYEAWCNQPAMGANYKRVVDDCFNLFNPIKYTPRQGTFENTVLFLKHLFGGKGNITFEDGKVVETGLAVGDPFTVALDYLTLQITHPKQILPVMCLVSPENNTGKTTFLKWLRDIYGSNATIIDNERFKQTFNSHYISKYIIGIDEGFLDVDKKSEKERLKKLATDDRQYLEFKGADTQEIDFYGKIIICSNDADNLMKIEEGEIRWFVVRVKPFTKENPGLRDNMRSEIPAWLHYLQTRKMIHPSEGRAWFAPEHLKTEQLEIIIEKTRNRIDRVVDEFVINTLEDFEILSFDIDLRGLADMINKNGYSKYKIDVHDLKNYLKDKKGMVPTKPKAIHFPTSRDVNTGAIYYDTSRTARCYHFTSEQWIKNIGNKPKARVLQADDERIVIEVNEAAAEMLQEKQADYNEKDPFGVGEGKYTGK